MWTAGPWSNGSKSFRKSWEMSRAQGCLSPIFTLSWGMQKKKKNQVDDTRFLLFKYRVAKGV